MRHVLFAMALALAAWAPPPETPVSGIRAYVPFCATYPGECKIDLTQPVVVHWTPRLERLLEKVDVEVNHRVVAMEDADHWGYPTADIWDFAEDGYGDCEDFQLVKRRELEKAGVPHRAMRMVAVNDLEGVGHAVLAVMTDKGPRILDNLTDRVTTAEETGYEFFKRESSYYTMQWVKWEE